MVNKNRPLVSIIMTTYNGEKYIEEALQSVIDQDYKEVEIIVIDDGSKDKTRAKVLGLGSGIKYFYQEHAGIAAGKNHGIEKASGNYYAFHDDDDIWTPGRLSSQVQILENDPELDLVFGHVKHFYSPEMTDLEKQEYQCPKELMPGVSSTTMLIKNDSFHKVGLFDSNYKKGIFNDWYLRASEMGLKSLMHPSVFLERRIHQSNHGIVHKDKSVDYVRMLKASLDRRRKSQEDNMTTNG